MKEIETNGISYLEPLNGSGGWYWGSDYTSGDLYEAEELYSMGHRIKKNRLVFAHYPSGSVLTPIETTEGQYFGRPAYSDGKLIILLVDFPAGEIRLIACDPDSGETENIVTIPRQKVKDCYNLMPHVSPLMLTRQSSDGKFQIIWPERVEFDIAPQESFDFRDGDKLYFSRWYEDPDYREEVVVRDLHTRAITDSFPGSTLEMPDGSKWLLK